MINVGIIGSGKWAFAISKVLKGVRTTIKTRNINKTKNFNLIIVNSPERNSPHAHGKKRSNAPSGLLYLPNFQRKEIFFLNCLCILIVFNIKI